jgi:hypothetical protein
MVVEKGATSPQSIVWDDGGKGGDLSPVNTDGREVAMAALATQPAVDMRIIVQFSTKKHEFYRKISV